MDNSVPSDDKNSDTEEIKILAEDDEYLKTIGELFSSETSRNIIKLLTENEMYKQQIATKLNIGVSTVIHHMNKMEKINLVKVTKKKIIRKGVEHNFYKISPAIVIPLTEKFHESNSFKRLVKTCGKFVAIGLASVASWFIYDWMPKPDERMSAPDIEPGTLVIPLVVIIIGLVVERILSKKK